LSGGDPGYGVGLPLSRRGLYAARLAKRAPSNPMRSSSASAGSHRDAPKVKQIIDDYYRRKPEMSCAPPRSEAEGLPSCRRTKGEPIAERCGGAAGTEALNDLRLRRLRAMSCTLRRRGTRAELIETGSLHTPAAIAFRPGFVGAARRMIAQPGQEHRRRRRRPRVPAAAANRRRQRISRKTGMLVTCRAGERDTPELGASRRSCGCSRPGIAGPQAGG